MLLTARVFGVPYRLPPLRLVPTYFGSRCMSMATAESLSQEIAQQTTLFNELRLQNAEPSSVEEAKKKLGELKKALGALAKTAGAGKDAKKKERMLLKTAKVRVKSCFPPRCSGVNLIIGYKRLWPRGDVLP